MIHIRQGYRFKMNTEVYKITAFRNKHVCVVLSELSGKSVFMRNEDINKYGKSLLKDILKKL